MPFSFAATIDSSSLIDPPRLETGVRLAHVSSPFGRGWVRVRSLNRKIASSLSPVLVSYYHIVFIDPKGTQHTEYEHKVDGYKHIFESSGTPKPIAHDRTTVRVYAFLYTADTDTLSKGYKKYWFENMDKVLDSIAA